MRNIFRYYNQNKRSIWLAIIAIIIIIIAIQAINKIVKDKNSSNNPNNIVNYEDYKNNPDINVLITEAEVKENGELIIDQFLRFCNANKIEEAYTLLTDSCKQELFPTIEEFKGNYYSKNFSVKKLYSKEKYTGNTYKIKLYEDILKNGDTKNIEDYFTIQKENGITKLNINNYIQTKEINKTSENEYLKIEVTKRKIYKEYEEYELRVTNLTYKTILLDSKESTKTMYLKGKNSVSYYALSHEVLLNNLCIRPKATQSLSIKYNKEYNSNQTINQLIFEDVILNYDEYKSKVKKSEYTDRTIFKINV